MTTTISHCTYDTAGCSWHTSNSVHFFMPCEAAELSILSWLPDELAEDELPRKYTSEPSRADCKQLDSEHCWGFQNQKQSIRIFQLRLRLAPHSGTVRIYNPSSLASLKGHCRISFHAKSSRLGEFAKILVAHNWNAEQSDTRMRMQNACSPSDVPCTK